MNKFLIIMAITFVGAGIAFFMFMLDRLDEPVEENDNPVVSDPVTPDEGPDMETYQSQEDGLRFSYPKEGEIMHEAGRVKVTYVGPNSHMTQITDGFTFYVRAEEMDGQLDELTQEKFEESTERLDPIQEPEVAEVQGETAYRFVIEGGLGNEVVHHVFAMNDRVFFTSHMISDPEGRGYDGMVDDIMDSIAVHPA